MNKASLRGVQTGRQRVIRVDECHVHIVQRPLASVAASSSLNLRFLGFQDTMSCAVDEDVGGILEADQALLSACRTKARPQLDGSLGMAIKRAVFAQFGDGVDFLRVGAERLDVNGAVGDRR